jgi:predicted TIM-barrel fold metal-dependent hydrolase
MMMNLDRRSFLKAIPTGVLCAQEAVRVPWSSGTEPPKTKAPANAADCHHHIYDSRFPIAKTATLRPKPATVADYRLLQKRIGTTRNVIVQPSTYGVDNSCLLDALRQFGTSNTRGIAVVNNDVPDAQLHELNAAGVRGIRFNLLQAGATTLDMLETLSRRVAPLGWHVQINASSPQIVSAATLFQRLPCPVVFDHFGHTLILGRDDPAFSVIVKQLQTGNGWLKLSGAYIDSKIGPPDYPESTPTAQAYVAEAPDQLVWGTDWPHPTTPEKPDDAVLFDLLARWVPNSILRRRILVENPAKLYGFS